jgi:hypothetical protein
MIRIQWRISVFQPYLWMPLSLGYDILSAKWTSAIRPWFRCTNCHGVKWWQWPSSQTRQRWSFWKGVYTFPGCHIDKLKPHSKGFLRSPVSASNHIYLFPNQWSTRIDCSSMWSPPDEWGQWISKDARIVSETSCIARLRPGSKSIQSWERITAHMLSWLRDALHYPRVCRCLIYSGIAL